jgi:transposase
VIATDSIPAGWVVAADSGQSSSTLAYWRNAKWLTEGRDCRRVPVDRPAFGRSHEWIYRRAALATAAKLAAGSRAVKGRERWAAVEELVSGNDRLVRQKAAVELLGVSKITLRRWTNIRCEHLGGARLATVVRPGIGGHKVRYWYRAELEKVLRRRAGSPREVTDADVYTFDQTAELTGLSPDLLRRGPDRERLRLEVQRRRVFAGNRRTGCAERMRDRLCFTRSSVDAYVRRAGRPGVPDGMMSIDQAAAELKAGRSTVWNWLKAGVLKGTRARAGRPEAGSPGGGLVTVESVQAARAAILRHGGVNGSLRLAGTMTATAKRAPAFTTEVGDAYDEYGCVRVSGKPVRVSEGTWELLRAMRDARTEGRGLSKSDLEKMAPSALEMLRRFVQNCPTETTPVTYPGKKSQGGYRLA